MYGSLIGAKIEPVFLFSKFVTLRLACCIFLIYNFTYSFIFGCAAS